MNDRAIVYRDGKVRAETKWQTPAQATAFADAYGAFLKKRGLVARIDKSGTAVTAEYTAK